MLSIPDILNSEQKLRADMALHIRALFKEPRSSEFHLDIATNEEAYYIASQLKKFSSTEGKLAAEHLSKTIYLLLGFDDPLNPQKPIYEILDFEFIKTHRLDDTQFIWIRFLSDNHFVVRTHTLLGFSSEEMSLKDIAVFYEIIFHLNERQF